MSNGNEPAYPTQSGYFFETFREGESVQKMSKLDVVPGLTKREYFAARNMSRFSKSIGIQEIELATFYAKVSVVMADALLKELEK